MKTTIVKQADLNRKWYIIDAKDKVLGRIATTIANKLRGKDKPSFTPHMDTGDFIVVINAEKVKLTGKKMSDKKYYRHSGYLGGLKEQTSAELIESKTNKVLELAVSGMLPKNRLRKVFMQKLKVYAGEEHPHAAQQPETLEV
ncbi:50S ribosomal protein L13 [Candidatus Peregrinibacteria bacterium]|nr:50S ribosomal protein L13 [Candidatus Peregrinibacteria bacterium]